MVLVPLSVPGKRKKPLKEAQYAVTLEKDIHLMRKRHRLSSRASKSSEHVISPISSPSEVAVALAFSAASLIWSHSELQL